jgi:thymidine phosphorylase
MKDIDSARELARTMKMIGEKTGRKVVVAITGMDQPLGYAVGNTIEVAEAIETLKGGGPNDLRELCIELGALLLATCHSERSEESLTASRERLDGLLSSGAALEKFREVIIAQGGDPRVIDDLSILPQPGFTHRITASSSGYVQSLNACEIGKIAGMLGAGRQKKEDAIDRTAGVLLMKKVGDPVLAGEDLAMLHYSRDIEIKPILSLTETAFVIGPYAPVVPPLIQEIIGL